MNGVHDMGGSHGFGPVLREENEPVFHEDWERTTRAIYYCLDKNKIANLDELRYAIERIKPEQYLASSYYERWLAGILILLIEKGVLSEDEIQAIQTTSSMDENLLDALTQLKYVPQKDMAQKGSAESSPKFKPGDKIKTKQVHSKVHMRVPRYASGKVGCIKEVQGHYILPETNIYTNQAVKEPVYLVEFDASDLWGPHVPRKDKVLIDVWESYLESADV